MKRNRKGFSLVELIVVLVIMAIIAALCAPNISAYVLSLIHISEPTRPY